MSFRRQPHWKALYDPQTVKLYSKTSRTAFADSVTIDHVGITEQEHGRVEADDLMAVVVSVVFHFFRTPMTAAGFTGEPKVGDKVEWQGAAFVVDEVRYLDRDSTGIQRFRCASSRAVG